MAHRLLIVDDQESIQMMLRDFFMGHGCEVDITGGVEDAKAMLDDTAYALVISDLSLTGTQGKEGIELLRHVRERFPRTRVILLTGYGSTEVEMEARGLNVDAFLRKPKPLHDLARIVFNVLEGPLEAQPK